MRGGVGRGGERCEEGEEEFGHGKGENRWEIRRQRMRMEWQGGRGGRTERKRKSRKRA